MSKHARLGPSNHRWPNCAGSVREEERYEDVAGAPAIDGTGSHLLLEMCLLNNVTPDQYDQQIIGVNHEDNPGGWLVQPDRIERVQMCLNYVNRRVNELKELYPDAVVLVEAESKSDPGGAVGRDDWNGTCDITITVKHKMDGTVYFVEVIDYKDGRGYVAAIDNSQLQGYLFGKMRPYVASGPDLVRPFQIHRVQNFRMTIVQPKTNPVVRYQCTTDSEHGDKLRSSFLGSIELLATAAHRTDDPDAPLTPGKHCQWCKANPKRGGHCEAQSKQSLQVVEDMSNTEMVKTDDSLFEYIGKAIADPKSMSPEKLAELADAEAGVQAVFDKVKDEIQQRIEQGVPVPGYAMQPGNSSRVWNESEDVIVKKLKGRRLKQSDIFPPKLVTPAGIDKIKSLTDEQKERIQKELVTVKAGKLSLKKVAHKAVAQCDTDGIESDSAEMMFGSVVTPPAKAESTDEVSFF